MVHRDPLIPLPATESSYLHALAALTAHGFAAPRETIDAILHVAAEQMNMWSSFLNRLLPEQNQVEIVAAYHAPGSGSPAPGTILAVADTYCRRVAGATPPAPLAVADADADPALNGRRPAALSQARSYIGVPVCLADGSLYGTLCATDLAPHLFIPADTQLLEVLAHLLATAIERERGTGHPRAARARTATAARFRAASDEHDGPGAVHRRPRRAL